MFKYFQMTFLLNYSNWKEGKEGGKEGGQEGRKEERKKAQSNFALVEWKKLRVGMNGGDGRWARTSLFLLAAPEGPWRTA